MKKFIRANLDFWLKYVPQCWDKEPLDRKLAWIVFGFYTMALLTIIELFLFKH